MPRINREKTGAGSAKSRQALCSRWNDCDIAATATVLLAWHDVDPGYLVMVNVDKGWITLSGHVDWPFKKDAVGQDVRRLPGVTGVTNEIKIRAEVATSLWNEMTPHDALPDADQNLARAAE